MKKIVIGLLSIALLMLTLVSCGNKGEVPKGMQLASNTDIVDYKLFVPEEWTVDRRSDFTSSVAFASDHSSISVSQWNLTDSTRNYDTWWTNEFKPELEYILHNPTIISEGDEIQIDGTDSKKYVYTGETREGKYKFMTVATIRQGSIYVITYTSTEELYDKHINEVNKILENIKFK